MTVLRLGYVHVRVTDLAGAAEHYRNTLGMDQVGDTDGRVYLKSWDEYDHHSVVLEEAGSGWSSSATRSPAPPTWTTTRNARPRSAPASNG